MLTGFRWRYKSVSSYLIILKQNKYSILFTLLLTQPVQCRDWFELKEEVLGTMRLCFNRLALYFIILTSIIKLLQVRKVSGMYSNIFYLRPGAWFIPRSVWMCLAINVSWNIFFFVLSVHLYATFGKMQFPICGHGCVNRMKSTSQEF